MRLTASLYKGKTVVLFDGSCPLCTPEIQLYRNNVFSDKLCFIDISDQNVVLSSRINRTVALSRFHVVSPDGQVLSGVSGFIEVWRHLRGWRWLAKIALIAGMLPILEVAYTSFLTVRPLIVKFILQVRWHKNEKYMHK